jgi:hypothetical protein
LQLKTLIGGMASMAILAKTPGRSTAGQVRKCRRPTPRPLYADDLIAFADSYDGCLAIHAMCTKELSKLGLTVPPVGNPKESKTNIAKPDEPIEFLGVSLERNPSGAGYLLQVPLGVLKTMEARIANFGTLDYLTKHNISIASIGRAMADPTDGWVSYYSYCDNAKIVETSLESWTAKAIKRLFRKELCKAVRPGVESV